MSNESAEPKDPGFWELRTGWRRLKHTLLLEPLSGGSRWAAAFGSLLLFSFVLQAVTGILLTMNYAPSVQTAWPSVKFIQDEVPLGWLIRGAHHWGASLMVILLLVHMVQVFVWGAYKRPREFTWMVGVLLLICALGLAFTGYLLPWDQRAYWATKVGLGMISTTPGIGDGLRALLQGGPQLGNLTLTRFFTLHAFVLPGLMVFLIVVHLYLFRLHGVTTPWWESPARLRAQSERFWPGQAWKDTVLALAALIGLSLWCYHWPAPLGEKSDPAQPYEARPEWYFMSLFQLLRYLKGPYEVLGTFVLPALFFVLLFFWPFLDRSPHRDPRRRPVAISLLAIGTVSLIGLTLFANMTDVRMHEPVAAVARAPAKSVVPAGPIQKLQVAGLYNKECASCHGVSGTGNAIRPAMATIPDFTSLAWQMSQTELAITHQIQEGTDPLMPAYKNTLSQPQILALAIYVRAFAIEPAATVPTPSRPSPAQEKAKSRPGEARPAVVAPEKNPVSAPVAARMSAEKVYRAYCLACHGEDGRGSLVRKAMPAVPDFTDAKWQTSRSASQLKGSILNGKGPFMLPMKDKLGGTDVEQMITYLRSFQQGKHVVKVQPDPLKANRPEGSAPFAPAPEEKPLAPSLARSEKTAARIRVATSLYRDYCNTCHGPGGKGTPMRSSMPSIPDFSDRSWQQSHSDPQFVVSMLNGKGSLMPAFRGRVSDDQARDLVAYLRALGPPRRTAVEAPESDFAKQFEQLQEQWNELEKQLQPLAVPAK
ncbi:MAG TPA: cytochrome b N-terminal domain-containing protein [Planctomycetaceae bacterium]|nr:cytochrome b N-terminal domain-containing protein [Planctomycetaceae bacterium]